MAAYPCSMHVSVNCTRATRVVVKRISRLNNQRSFSPVAKLVVALPRNHHHCPSHCPPHGSKEELQVEKLQESGTWTSDIVDKKRPNCFTNPVWTAKDLGYSGYTFPWNAFGVFMGLYAITGLLVGARNNVGDMEKDAFYQFIQKTNPIHPIAMAVALYAMGGFPYLIWGIAVRVVWVYHITWFVNSASHVWGSQKWNSGDLSRNNWWVAVLAFGEGWHNNHHAFEYSTRHGLEWRQLDPTWWIIRSLEAVGLATKVFFMASMEVMEARLVIVENDVATLKSDVNELKSDVNELKSDVNEVKSDVKIVKSEVEKITLESNRRWLISTIIMVLMLISQWIFKS